MNNASKAIIIAGGFFIGVLIISLFMYMLTMFRDFQKLSDDYLTEKEIVAFNGRFLDLISSEIVKGYQIYNLIGLIIDENNKPDSSFYRINLVAGSMGTLSSETDLKKVRDAFYFTEYLGQDYTVDDIEYVNGIIHKIAISGPNL